MVAALKHDVDTVSAVLEHLGPVGGFQRVAVRDAGIELTTWLAIAKDNPLPDGFEGWVARLPDGPQPLAEPIVAQATERGRRVQVIALADKLLP